ncbi:late promoter transcription accessory protein [Vibrio phage ValKK3]|nr:late promoter transcription accessory protein [Vibrio phage ValKK3]AJT61100.1 late promoter transcription accessory protein [Vibrio phage ValKK3]
MNKDNYVLKEELGDLVPPIKGSLRQQISLEIEEIYNSCPAMTYLEACLFFIEQYDYDISRFPYLINQTLKDKIETEAINEKTIRSRFGSASDLGQWV